MAATLPPIDPIRGVASVQAFRFPMIEQIEFRVIGKHATGLLSPEEMVLIERHVGIYRVRLDLRDPRIPKLLERHRSVVAQGVGALLGAWEIVRDYSEPELARAKALLLKLPYFGGVGEDDGTRYDERAACPICGVGRRQVSALRVSLKGTSKRAGIAESLANELVVHQRVADVLVSRTLSGFALLPVLPPRRRNRDRDSFWDEGQIARLLCQVQEGSADWESWAPLVAAGRDRGMVTGRSQWYQLVIVGCRPHICAATLYGERFDKPDAAGTGRCPCGATLGVARLSEVTIDASLAKGLDVALTAQHAGMNRNFYRPRPEIIVSQRFVAALREAASKYELEVANVREATGAQSAAG